MQQNIIVYLGDLVGRSLSVEWFIISFSLSLIAGLLMPKARLTPIFAAIAALIHVVVLAALPALKAGGMPTMDALVKELTANAKGPDLAVLAVEYCFYMFMIWIVYLSKYDLFRPTPPRSHA